jgi:hypothetical protein
LRYAKERGREMSIENAIKDVISESLESGIIERLVKENLEKGINNSLEHLFSRYGEATRIIENEIKSVILKQLESVDYTQYIVKLDHVLVEILQNTTLDNRKILDNFKDLIVDENNFKAVKVSDIFGEYVKHVSENVETINLEIDYDDGVSYQNVNATLDVEYQDKRSWSSYEHATIVLECAEDENLNMEIELSRYQDKQWEFNRVAETTIRALRNMDNFQIYLLKLSQNWAKIEIDENNIEEEVTVEAEPEASFS